MTGLRGLQKLRSIVAGLSPWDILRYAVATLLVTAFAAIIAAQIVPPGIATVDHPNVGECVLAFAMLIVAAFLCSRSWAKYLASPLTGFIDSVFLGRGNADTPPVTLRLARRFRADFQYDEAIEECRRQLEYHPRAFELWEEMVLAVLDGGQFDSARSIVTEAASHLSGPEIQTLRDLISTQLHNVPAEK